MHTARVRILRFMVKYPDRGNSDDDGDVDAFIGEYHGNVVYFENLQY